MKKLDHPLPEKEKSVSRTAVRILRRHQVQDVTGLKKSQIYALATTPNFPQRVKLGTRAVGYLEHEVQAWIESRVKASRGSAGGAR